MSYTGKAFLEALKTDSLHEPIVLVGLVKSDDDPNAILLDPTLLCTGHWIRIPADLIAKADVLGKLPCKDHTHDLVRLELKEPDSNNAEAVLFSSLLRTARQRTPQVRSPFGRSTCLGSDAQCYEMYGLTAPCLEVDELGYFCSKCCLARKATLAGIQPANIGVVPVSRRKVRPTFTGTANDVYKMCFYERDGQYAGSAIYYSFESAAKACQNWQDFHGGTCFAVDENEACPT